jgi:hypothetical protein
MVIAVACHASCNTGIVSETLCGTREPFAAVGIVLETRLGWEGAVIDETGLID